MTTDHVSIVIPTRNGMQTLPALFDALARQHFARPLVPEIVVVDSGSVDGTVEYVRARATRVLEIAAADFDHGVTRNLAIQHTSGEFIVLLVQDAVPAANDCLSALMAPLLADVTVAGTYARQRLRPEASALTRSYAERWRPSRDAAYTAAVSNDDFERLEPMERLRLCTFDNVCSCIRRSVWETHPFRPTTIAEDIEWAKDVLLAGYCIEFAPRAVVVHSHDRSARYELARTYLLHRRLFELLGVRTVPSLPDLLRAIVSSLVFHVRCESAVPDEPRRMARLARAIALAGAWPIGQYVGGLSAARGWSPIRSRSV